MKFTPGPWAILSDEVDKDYIRVRGTQNGSRYKIANVITPVYPGVHKQEVQETRANARLIAAAPELFEMLLKTVKVLERVGNDTLDGRNTVQDARNLINEIIRGMNEN